MIPYGGLITLITLGGYAEYAVADERSVMPMDVFPDMEKAGSVPETWLTVRAQTRSERESEAMITLTICFSSALVPLLWYCLV
jgi:NADPH:quinone reductase-like Zn-dependent oxidoreductase